MDRTSVMGHNTKSMSNLCLKFNNGNSQPLTLFTSEHGKAGLIQLHSLQVILSTITVVILILLLRTIKMKRFLKYLGETSDEEDRNFVNFRLQMLKRKCDVLGQPVGQAGCGSFAKCWSDNLTTVLLEILSFFNCFKKAILEKIAYWT